MLTLSDFDFELPPELIAQFPIPERSASRLLNVQEDSLADQSVSNLPDLLMPGDLMVFNDTRVLKARFFGQKDTGGKVEVLAERQLDAHQVLARVRASKSPAPGSLLRLADAFDVTVMARDGEFFVLQFPENFSSLGEQYGHLPLPPYISRAADSVDEARYQTVYASQPGAIAAPTAGLHFDEPLLERLREKGVNMAYLTLHVGAGTFQPVRTENLAEHVMHSEVYSLPQKTVDAIRETRARGNRVIAVGTTSLRALESAAQSGDLLAGTQETRLFITPGYHFKVVDRLLTNFHLPKSTLLMLVSAFAGYAQIRHAYAHAIQQGYRFFSYGDAMLLNHLHN